MIQKRHYLVLAISILAFGAMIALVTVGVTTRRRARDFKFGLERFDVLFSDRKYEEAADLLPWLAGRTSDARDTLSVLKRGLLLYDAGTGSQALFRASLLALERYPGNDLIRSIAGYAALISDQPERALALTRDFSGDLVPGLFPWVLLSNDLRSVEFPGGEEAEPDVFSYLVTLDRRAGPEDLERAFIDTGDWRYAVDAVLLHLRDGSKNAASALVANSSLNLFAPLLAADVHLDRGEAARALTALSNASDADEPVVSLRKADAWMILGRYSEAEAAYENVIRDHPGESVVPFVSLAWIRPADAEQLFAQAAALHPNDWRAYEQRAIFVAQTDVDAAIGVLSGFPGSQGDVSRSLLVLKLSGNTDAASYETRIWSLLSDDETSVDALRLAAWHFYTRRDYDELALLLDRSGTGAAWHHQYSGLLAAVNGDWRKAADEFEHAAELLAGWRNEFNLAVALLALSETEEAMQRLTNAITRAEIAGFPADSAILYVLRAKTSASAIEGYEAAVRALEIDPTNTRALLLRDAFLIR